MLNFLFVVIFSIIFIASVNSEEIIEKYTTSRQYDLCLQNVVSTYDVLACMEKELKRQDKLLNANYKKVINELQAERKTTLRSAQRSWINYRDKQCSLYYHKYSGSAGLLDKEYCHIKETIKRAAELSEMIGQ